MSLLYLVATPIGNLEDITFRAVRVLKEVALIAAEDTRTTKTLLSKYQIRTPIISYHDHNKKTKTPVLLDHLKDQDLALVSDAGTPGINDPAYYLVNAALAEGHRLIPIPGPSAPITALSASGLPTDAFLYLGYLPKKTKARCDMFAGVKNHPWTIICLETPHRLIDALKDLQSVLGDREITVARELTKIHEEILRGPISEIRNHYHQNHPKGEITLVLAGKPSDERWTEDKITTYLKDRKKTGTYSPTELAKSLAKESGWSRRDIYDLIQGLDNGSRS